MLGYLHFLPLHTSTLTIIQKFTLRFTVLHLSDSLLVKMNILYIQYIMSINKVCYTLAEYVCKF